MKIKKGKAYEILDSRGNPTIEINLTLEDGQIMKDSIPSGASTGSKEALELRDGDPERFGGKGVLKACESVDKILEEIKDIDVTQQEKIDRLMIELDGTGNKSKLGANAIMAVSLAVCRAGAYAEKKPLWQYIQEKFGFKQGPDWNFPIPMINVINGGAHSDSGLDVQEYMLVPVGLDSFFLKMRAGSEVYQALKEILVEKDYRTAVGDEGGFAPRLKSNEEALVLLSQAIEKAGYKLGSEIKTGLDVAASEFYDKDTEKYNLGLDKKNIEVEELFEMYKKWMDKYSLALIEDPLSEFDWKSWSEFNEKFGNEIDIIGDDLLVTNKKLVERAIEEKACNAVLIKVNQIGTISETINAIKIARGAGMKIAVSHRSGETKDDFIADLAVAVESDYVKFGAPARGERVAKYNRIIEIEKEIRNN
jgi:enolase 1/2/3